MACETIQEKLVSDESLTGPEREHLQACSACRSFAAAVQGVAAAGAQLADFGPASAVEQAALRERIEARLAPPSLTRRLAFALPALALGVMGVVAMLALGGRTDAGRTGAAVFALMDEVDGIASAEDRVAVVEAPAQAAADEASDEALQTTSLLDEVDQVTADSDDDDGLLSDLFGAQEDDATETDSLDLDLPGGYQLIDDVIEDRWM